MPILSNHNNNVSGDVLWTQDIFGTDGDTRLLCGQIKAIVDTTVVSNAVPLRLEFWTATSGGTLTKALTISSAQLATFVGNLSAANVTSSAIFSLSGVENSITAHAGGTQAAAFALSATKSIHNITIAGSANDSVVLPASTGGGAVHWVKNSAAANSAQLFGLSADTIDGVTASTGVAVAAGKSRIVVDAAVGTWLSILGA